MERQEGDRISKLLANIEALISDNNAKATVFDFIRLAQLEPELEETETPRGIKVTWIENAAILDTEE